MNLYFSNNYYKNKALGHSKRSYEEINHTVEDAFLILIKDLGREDLTNLCLMIKDYFNSLKTPINISMNDCYKLTQGNNLDSIVLDEQLKEIILDLMVYAGIYLIIGVIFMLVSWFGMKNKERLNNKVS